MTWVAEAEPPAPMLMAFHAIHNLFFQRIQYDEVKDERAN